MKKESLIKGFLIKPIMEVLKKDYDIKSPSPNNLFVSYDNDVLIVKYSYSKGSIDFSNNEMVMDILVDIKNNVLYEKVQL